MARGFFCFGGRGSKKVRNLLGVGVGSWGFGPTPLPFCIPTPTPNAGRVVETRVGPTQPGFGGLGRVGI